MISTSSFININNKKIKFILFFFIVLILTRQIPLAKYSNLMNFAILIFFVLEIKSILTTFYYSQILFFQIFFMSIIVVAMTFSIFFDNELFLAIKFTIIILLISLAYAFTGRISYVKIFYFFIILQAIVVLTIEIYFMINYNLSNYNVMRQYIISSDWGDVYSRNGLIWKVQIRGSALLLFGFLIIINFYKGRLKHIFSLILFSAVIFAGNFAYIVGLMCYLILFYFYKMKKKNYLLLIVLGFVLLGFLFILFFNEFQNVVIQKSVSSNPVRLDQIKVLLNDLIANPVTLLTGRGLGHQINIVTEWRDYSEKIYYELQAVYLLNQTGIIVGFIFIFLNIYYSLIFFKNRLIRIIYFTYIVYALFNPYFLDTSHLVVIIVLKSLNVDVNKIQNSNLLIG